MQSTADAVSRAVPVAERMRQYRARRRADGLTLARRWVRQGTVVAPFSDHRLLELRSLTLHGAIARKVHANPQLLDRVRLTLDRWDATASDRVRPVLDEWRALLARPVSELCDVMTRWDEDSIRLRQSSPFAGILDPSARKAIFEAFRP